MKKNFFLSEIFLIIMAMVLSISCGGKKEQPEEKEKAKNVLTEKSKAISESLNAAAEAIEAMKEEAERTPENVEPVNFKELIKLMPEPFPGWKIKEKPTGKTQTYGAKWSYSEAKQIYVKDDSIIELYIKDGAYIPMLYTMFAFSSAYSEETSDKYKKGFTKGDNKGFEEYNYNNKSGNINLLIAKRFIIEANGQKIENNTILHNLIDKIDQKKLEELGTKK